jgi:hypothetical protein
MNNEEKNLSNEENDLPVEEVLEENSQAEEKKAKKLSKGALIGIIAGAVAVIIAVVLIIVLSGNKACEHTFSDKWYSDATNHWHPATCEHAETAKGDLAPHVDADEDGICDVCEYEVGHKHSYQSDWIITDTHHWQKATCTHTNEKNNYSTHSDENIDGVCDVCSGHVHKINAAGYCVHEGCGEKFGEVDETSLDALVKAVVEQNWLINGGNIDYTFTGRSNTGIDFQSARNEKVSYLFGKDNYTYTHVTTHSLNSENKASGTLETWHQFMNANETFGVVSVDGGTPTLDISESAKLNGYYIALSNLAGDYGVEATLYALYEAAIADTTDELVVTPDNAENKVSFKYSYKTAFVNESNVSGAQGEALEDGKVYNVSYFEVEVIFTYSDDFALTSLNIVVDCYTNDPGSVTIDGETVLLYDDVDIQYNPETGDITFVEYVRDENGGGTFVPTEKRTPDTYVINVTQTVGKRTEENPNPQSKFVPDSFDLFLTIDEKTGELSDKYDGGVIKADIREGIHIFVGNYSPKGTPLHFAQDLVSIKLFRNNEEIGDFEDYTNKIAYLTFTLAGEQREFLFVPKADGTYVIQIYFMGNKTDEITVHVGLVDDGNIELEENEFAAKVYESYEWSNEVTFTAAETGKYWFTVPAGVGIVDADAYDAAEKTSDTGDSPKPYIDYNMPGKENGGTFGIELKAGQTIRFYANAAKRGFYIIDYYRF